MSSLVDTEDLHWPLWIQFGIYGLVTVITFLWLTCVRDVIKRVDLSHLYMHGLALFFTSAVAQLFLLWDQGQTDRSDSSQRVIWLMYVASAFAWAVVGRMSGLFLGQTWLWSNVSGASIGIGFGLYALIALLPAANNEARYGEFAVSVVLVLYALWCLAVYRKHESHLGLLLVLLVGVSAILKAIWFLFGPYMLGFWGLQFEVWLSFIPVILATVVVPFIILFYYQSPSLDRKIFRQGGHMWQLMQALKSAAPENSTTAEEQQQQNAALYQQTQQQYFQQQQEVRYVNVPPENAPSYPKQFAHF